MTALQQLPGWQAFGLIVIGLVLAAVAIQVGGGALIRRLTDRIEGDVDDIILQSIHPPLYISVVLLGAYLARDALSLEARLAFGIEATVLSVLTVIWAFTLTRIGQKLSDELTVDADRDTSVVPIFQNVWTAVIVGGAACLLLTFWNVDVTPLMASAGIIGIVVGFAARDTIANSSGPSRCTPTGPTGSATTSSSSPANAAASRTSPSGRRSSEPATTSSSRSRTRS